MRDVPCRARPGFSTRERAAQAYAALSGRSVENIKPYRVLTMFKLGVVFQQLHAPHRESEAGGERYAAFAELGHELLAFTLDIAKDRVF